MKRLLKLEMTLVLFVVVFTLTGESITSILSQNSSFQRTLLQRFSDSYNRFNLSVLDSFVIRRLYSVFRLWILIVFMHVECGMMIRTP